MAEPLLSIVAERIIQTLGSQAVEQIGLLWGVKDELQSLIDTVSIIKDVLLDAEDKQAAGDRAVKRWLGRLEDVIYDADDLLDAVSTKALRREIMTRDSKAKKVRIFFSGSNQLAIRFRMAREIKAIRKKLDAINADRQNFHLEVRQVEPPVGNRERYNTNSLVRAETVIGREDDKEAVIDLLLDSNVEDNVSILPIVGIGGLGKTTLAQFVFNDDQIKKHFELNMWVCVSDIFDVKIIVAKILESATTEVKSADAEMDTLVGKLREKIEGKKYFLVLDDVWNGDHAKWCCLKQVLMGGARGSRIVVTTRNEIVAKTIRQESVPRIIGTVESYFLKGLDEDASWSLFKHKAFERGQEPENSNIVALGKEIVKKCSGVPLAISTIRSLLGSKNSEIEWLSFKNNDLSKISENETGLLPTLKLSYDHLPSHLKHCFAYCSLFPKDYVFHIPKLIRLWIAQGFVKLSDQNQCLEDVGNEYFMNLLGRSFFQETIMDEFGNLIVCKMHDLMHDLAISVARSMITTLDDDEERNISEKTRHVSIVGDGINISSITTSLTKASRLRTIISPSINYYVHHIFGESDCEAIFSSSKFLRVLELHGRDLDFLPSSIGKLKHLRYLDLSENDKLKKLPNSITRLQNLQALILSGCSGIEELPRDIQKLVNLKHLYMDGCLKLTYIPRGLGQNLQILKLTFCDKLEELPSDIQKLVNLRHLEMECCFSLAYMPRGLGQLTNLQTLSNFVVHKDPLSRHSSGLKELNGLNNLRGSLDITNLRHGKDAMSECKAANLKEKQHLHALGLHWSIEEDDVIASDDEVDALGLQWSIEEDDVIASDDEVLLEVLQPHLNLKRLQLVRNYGSRLPTWLSSLTNLVRFELWECRKCQYLPPLNQLPFLKVLELIGMDAMEYISSGSGDSNEFSSFFPSLGELWLQDCPNLKGWWRRRDSSVEVNSDSHNFVDITEHPLLPFFPRLSYLHIWSCPMLTSMPMFPHLEEELYMYKASSKPLQQTMMMNMAAPQSPTSTATTFSSFTPLSKLNSITLSFIADLETLPEQGLKNLTSLKFLKILRCNRLNSLSPGIRHLTALQRLYLHDCPELELANDEDGMQWQGLQSLLSLEFLRLPKLVSLPLGLQHAPTLLSLEISYCENLTAIPEWIHNCTSLQKLEIDECASLTSLPEGIRSLTSLQMLKIKGCPILLRRCKREVGEDWAKIAHIPELELTESDAEVAEPAKAQKKQRIWSIFKKSRALNL